MKPVSVKTFTPTTCCSPDSMRRVLSTIEPTNRFLQLVDRFESAAEVEHIVQFRPRSVA